MIRPKHAVLFIIALSLSLPRAAGGQTVPAGDLSAKVLPSVVSLAIQLPDGKTAAGVGFLTLKDGLLATAWHLAGQARGAVATFSNGEEFECPGVIDKDVKRNIALVRIKTFGRPVLKMEPAEPAPGTPVAVAAVKEGAFGLIEASTEAAIVIDNIRFIPLSGDVSGASSGGPVVNERGEVVGLLVSLEIEGRPAFFAVPAAYLLGLDVSLPTQPWSVTASSAAEPAAAKNLTAVEEIDARIGRALLALTEDEVCLTWADETTKGTGFLSGVPNAVYEIQQGLDTAMASLSEVRTDDELRLRVGKAVLQMLTTQKAASENFIRAVVIGQQVKSWDAQSQDAQMRGNTLRQTVSSQIAGLKPDLAALEAGSSTFREYLPFEQRRRLGLADRPSGYRLGISVYPRNPFYFLVLAFDGFGRKIGFRPGDKVVSVAGRAFSVDDDLEELKLLIKSNLGQTIPAVVERNGKIQDIRLKIPKEIPKEAFYTP